MNNFVMIHPDFYKSIQGKTTKERDKKRNIVMELYFYLMSCPNGLGSYTALPNLCRNSGIRRTQMLEVINESGIFHSPEDSDFFYSPQLRRTLCLPPHPNEAEREALKEYRFGDLKEMGKALKKQMKNREKDAQKLTQMSQCLLQHAEDEPPAYNKDRDREIKDRYPSPPSSSRNTRTLADDGDGVILRIFKDYHWLRMIERHHDIPVASDELVSDIAATWFQEHCMAADKHPATEQDAKRYFNNILRPGLTVGQQLRQYIAQERQRRTSEQQEEPERSVYEHLINGKRYSYNYRPLPSDAPPQTNMRTEWSYRFHQWIPLDQYDVEEEQKRRKEENE